MFCSRCGAEINDKAVICIKCGENVGKLKRDNACASKSRLIYIILALFLGALGIHNFYAGRIGCAVAQLLTSLILGWLFIPLIFILIWILIEICTVTRDGNGNNFT